MPILVCRLHGSSTCSGDTGNDRQAESGASTRTGSGAVHPVETFEQLVHLCFGESRRIVDHIESDVTVSLTKYYGDGRAFRGVYVGIREGVW